MNEITPSASCTLSRRDIRSIIFHLLYALESLEYSASAQSVALGFNSEYDMCIPVDGEIISTVTSVVDKRVELDDYLLPFLANWRLERLGCCTRLIVRLALWEMLYTDTPSTIVINEAIELAKCFSEKDAYKFVNGILDEVAKKLDKEKQETPQ